MGAILNFMYLGETNVEQCHLESFMAACNIIRVRGLTEPETEEPNKDILPTERPNIFSKTIKSPSTVKPDKNASFDEEHEKSSDIANFESSEDFPSLYGLGKFSCNKCDFQTGIKVPGRSPQASRSGRPQ